MKKTQSESLFKTLNNEGIVILEVLLSILIFSIIIIVLLNIFSFSIKSTSKLYLENSITKDINHALEYVFTEVKNADTIYYTTEIKNFNKKFNKNIGFIIKRKDEDTGIYNYVSYYINDNNLVRIAFNSKVEKLPSVNNFKGFNKLANDIKSFEGSHIDLEKNYIKLVFNSIGDDFSKEKVIFLDYMVNPYEKT